MKNPRCHDPEGPGRAPAAPSGVRATPTLGPGGAPRAAGCELVGGTPDPPARPLPAHCRFSGSHDGQATCGSRRRPRPRPSRGVPVFPSPHQARPLHSLPWSQALPRSSRPQFPSGAQRPWHRVPQVRSHWGQRDTEHQWDCSAAGMASGALGAGPAQLAARPHGKPQQDSQAHTGFWKSDLARPPPGHAGTPSPRQAS